METRQVYPNDAWKQKTVDTDVVSAQKFASETLKTQLPPRR